jgi:hypothetical protein
MVCVAWARALPAAANTVTGAAANVNPMTALRLVIEVETACAMVISLVMRVGQIRLEHGVRLRTLFLFQKRPTPP